MATAHQQQRETSVYIAHGASNAPNTFSAIFALVRNFTPCYNIDFTALYTITANFLFQTPRISHTSVSVVPLSHAVTCSLDMSGFLMDTTALTKGYKNLSITKTRRVMLLRNHLQRHEV
jgi:hypothetical protein